MCIAEGEGSRFSALLNSGLFEFQIFTNLATKSGYIKLTEICLYFCPYRKTLISTKSNTLPGISFRNGQVFRTLHIKTVRLQKEIKQADSQKAVIIVIWCDMVSHDYYFLERVRYIK